MNQQDEILRRLKELERENNRLRKMVDASPGRKETTTHISMFKGRPVITFSGQFRPFTLGIRKASVVLEKVQDVKDFIEQNKRYLKNAEDDEEELPPAPPVDAK